MARRPGRRPVDPDSPVVDLDRVLADDSWIDQVRRDRWTIGQSTGGTGANRASGGHRSRIEGEPLFDLLDEWRTELTHRPLPPVPTVVGPVSRPVSGSRRVRRPRSLRPMLAVAAAIGAVVVGSATIGAADADPDSPFWPVTRALLPDRAASMESAGAARTSLDEARTALGSGRTREAQAALWRAADELRILPRGAEHNHLQQDLVALWVAAAPTQGNRPPIAGPWAAAVSTTPSTGGATQSASVPSGSAPARVTGETVAAPIPVTAVGGQQPDGRQPAGSGPAAPVGTSTSVAARSDSQSSTGALGGSTGPSALVTDPESPPTPPPPAVAPVDPGTSSSSGTTASTPPSAPQQSAPSPPPASSNPSSEESTPGAAGSGDVDASAQSDAAPADGEPDATPVDTEGAG